MAAVAEMHTYISLSSSDRSQAAVQLIHLPTSPTAEPGRLCELTLTSRMTANAANMSLGSDTQLLASASPQGLRAGQLRRETPQNLRSLSALTTKCNVGTLLP